MKKKIDDITKEFKKDNDLKARIKDKFNNNVDLQKTDKLAEMVGIILGDGNIYFNNKQKKYYLRISFNRREEKQYLNYVKQKMKEIFKLTPSISNKKDRAGTDLILQNKKLVKRLNNIGLKSGNKVENQVKVPEWIKNNKKYKKRCLRGLLDTDGSIYLRNTQKAIGINFKNASYPLIRDFKQMCETLDINTQKIPKPKIYTNIKTGESFKSYQVSIENKSQVAKFLNIIKPKKWEYRAEIIGIALISLKDQEKRGKIEQSLFKKYPDKKTHYSRKYKKYLKNLCEKNGYLINRNTIKNAIRYSLHDKRKPFKIINLNLKNLINELNEIL